MVLVMVGGQLGHLKNVTSPHPAVTRSPDFKGVSWKTLLEFSLTFFIPDDLNLWMVENNRPYIATSDFANFGIFDPDAPDYTDILLKMWLYAWLKWVFAAYLENGCPERLKTVIRTP